jgi:hypothetical protein
MRPSPGTATRQPPPTAANRCLVGIRRRMRCPPPAAPRRAARPPAAPDQAPATMANEQTYIMIKPDGVQRGLVGEIIKRFEARGYTLKGARPARLPLPPPGARQQPAACPAQCGITSYHGSAPGWVPAAAGGQVATWAGRRPPAPTNLESDHRRRRHPRAARRAPSCAAAPSHHLAGLKMLTVEKAHAQAHYADLSSKPFFAGLVDYICRCALLGAGGAGFCGGGRRGVLWGRAPPWSDPASGPHSTACVPPTKPQRPPTASQPRAVGAGGRRTWKLQPRNDGRCMFGSRARHPPPSTTSLTPAAAPWWPCAGRARAQWRLAA